MQHYPITHLHIPKKKRAFKACRTCRVCRTMYNMHTVEFLCSLLTNLPFPLCQKHFNSFNSHSQSVNSQKIFTAMNMVINKLSFCDTFNQVYISKHKKVKNCDYQIRSKATKSTINLYKIKKRTTSNGYLLKE